jgi:sugar lactone lactonase YvrE
MIRSAAALLALLLVSPTLAQHGGVVPSPRAAPLADPGRPPAQGLEVVATFADTPGNVAVTPQGRVFVSMHPFGGAKSRVVEVLPEGGVRPYPTPGWSGPVRSNGVGIQSIIGIRSDAEGILWMLDMGTANEGEGGTPPKLVAWDTKTDRLVRVIHIPAPASHPKSFLQDFAIDPKNEAIYIADCGIGRGFEDPEPAIVVVHLRTGASRRVLAGARQLRAEPDAAMTIDGRAVETLGPDGTAIAPRIGINPITIDVANEWVIFGSMHGRTLWRVKAADLANPSLVGEQLSDRIERFGDKGLSDGITIDSAGNVYVTDVERNAIGVFEPGVGYRILYEDPELLSWPDGMSVGPDGNIYLVVNQLHRHPALSAGEDRTKPPFRLLRFRPIAPAQVGR